MNHFMASQTSPMSEFLGTEFTRKWFLSSMNQFMGILSFYLSKLFVTNLTCKQCTDTLSIFKREFGDKVIEYQDFSCFLLNSIFETHTACRLIKEENGRSAAIKFFNRLFQQLRITNQACDCSNEVFSEVSREEEVNYFFEQLSNLFSSFILE